MKQSSYPSSARIHFFNGFPVRMPPDVTLDEIIDSHSFPLSLSLSLSLSPFLSFIGCCGNLGGGGGRGGRRRRRLCFMSCTTVSRGDRQRERADRATGKWKAAASIESNWMGGATVLPSLGRQPHYESPLPLPRLSRLLLPCRALSSLSQASLEESLEESWEESWEGSWEGSWKQLAASA